MDGQLDTQIETRPNGATLTIKGEVDLAVVHSLATAFEKACAAAPPELIVDVSEMTYCDSAGVAQFVTASTICDRDGFSMRIVGATPIVRRVFEGCGLVDMLEPDGAGE